MVDWSPAFSRSDDGFLFVYGSTNTSQAPTTYVTKQEPRLPIIKSDGFIIKHLNQVRRLSVFRFHIRYIALTEYKNDFLWHKEKKNLSVSHSEYVWQRLFKSKVLLENNLVQCCLLE